MRRLSLIVGVLVLGALSLTANGQNPPQPRGDGQTMPRFQTVTPVPLDEDERALIGARSGPRSAGATGEVVYQHLELGGGYFPQSPTTNEQQALQWVADDITPAPGTARELVSFRVMVHQRSAEGSVPYSITVVLWTSDRLGPHARPVAPIPNTECTVDGLGPLSFAECTFPGDSGIILPEKFYLVGYFSGGCAGTNIPDACFVGTDDPLGPGWLIADVDSGPTIGSTECNFLVTGNRGKFWLEGFCSNAEFVIEITAKTPAPIPTVSEWGMVFIVLLVLTGGTIILRRRRARSIA